MFQPVFTKEFLEKQLNREVLSFTVGPGSKPGDNFMGVVYALNIKLKPELCLREIFENETETETIHIVAKCYPNHPARHEYLNQASVFRKELAIYQILMNKFESFLEEENIQLDLPIPPLIAGKAVDYSKQGGVPKPKLTPSGGRPLINVKGPIKKEAFLYGPLDNFLLLTDIRKTLGFKMIPQKACMNWDHCTLVVTELAKIHAVSWAYRLKNGKKRLFNQFQFLKQPSFSPKADIQKNCNSHFESALKTLEKYLGKDSPVVEGTKKFQKNALEILGWFQSDGLTVNGVKEIDLNKFMRISESEKIEDYVPWNVFTHGDCWVNNMLFKYNGTTGLPEKVIFVDFQVSKDACPTVDLAYMIYLCTDQQFRKNHLDELLRLYHDSFIYYCSLLNIKLLPGFSLESLKCRFRRSKLFAYLMCLIVFPITLRQQSVDLDKIKTKKMKTSEVFIKILNGTSNNTLLHQKIIEVATDFYNDGII